MVCTPGRTPIRALQVEQLQITRVRPGDEVPEPDPEAAAQREDVLDGYQPAATLDHRQLRPGDPGAGGDVDLPPLPGGAQGPGVARDDGRQVGHLLTVADRLVASGVDAGPVARLADTVTVKRTERPNSGPSDRGPVTGLR